MALPDPPDALLATSPEGLREQALRSVKKRRDFHTHAFIYVVMNLVIWGIWVVIGVTSHAWFPWPIFVTLGWGIGLAANAWDVFVSRPITEADVQREMDRLQHRQ